MPRRLLLAALACALLPATASAAPLAEGGLRIVGASGDGTFDVLPTPVDSSSPGARSVSQDGRYIAFSSLADGLVGDDYDEVRNVYVKDRQTGAIELASRQTGADGGVPDKDCSDPSISDNGRRVAFVCSGLLAPTDTNDAADIYVRDLDAKTTTLISSGPNGVGNSSSGAPEISGNGNFVVFESTSTNLLVNGNPSGMHIYRRTVAAGTPDLVDVGKSNATPDGIGYNPTISDSGLRVAFTSLATNLSAAVTDTNSQSDVYWRDYGPATPVTALASSVQNAKTTPGNGSASHPSISGDGLYVAYNSSSSNLGDGDPDTSDDIHRRTLDSAIEVLVSRANGLGGTKATGGFVTDAQLDDSGDAVVFETNSSTFSPNGRAQIVLRRVTVGTTELVSRASGDGTISATDTAVPAISDDGKVVALRGRGLAPDADLEQDAVFARIVSGDAAKPTTLVSRPAGDAAFANTGGQANAGAGSLSADGRYSVFTSAARGLPGDHPVGVAQAWRRDNLTGAVALVSRGVDGAPASKDVAAAVISGDGNRIAFVHTTDTTEEVLVRDVAAGTTTRASVDGNGNGYEAAEYPAISADGTRVAFVVLNLGGTYDHVVVRDLGANTSTVVGGSQPLDAAAPTLSASGSRVAWQAGLSGGIELNRKKIGGGEPDHVFVADVGGEPTQVDTTAGSSDSDAPSLSGDGKRIAFSTGARLVDADANDNSDIYVVDLPSGAPQLASATPAGAGSDGSSYLPALSADGSRVAFLSGATNLIPDDAHKTGNAYLRTLSTGATVKVAAGDGPGGAVGAVAIKAVAVNADGGCVQFSTPASDFLPGLSAGISRVWLRAVHGTCPTAPVVVTPTPTPTVTATPTVTPKPTRPVVSKFTASRKALKRRGKKAKTTFSWKLDQTATVRLVLARKVVRKKKTRYVKVRTLKATGVKGTNTLRFKATRKLKRGRYRVTLTATSAGGTSKPVRLTLKVRK